MDLIALQECTKHVLKKLRPLLEREGWVVVGKDHYDDAVIIYDEKQLRLDSHEVLSLPSSFSIFPLNAPL